MVLRFSWVGPAPSREPTDFIVIDRCGGPSFVSWGRGGIGGEGGLATRVQSSQPGDVDSAYYYAYYYVSYNPF